MKKNFRFCFSILIAKLAVLGLRILRRPASYLPGKIAVTLCPDFIGHMGRPKTVIAVTGTNGKTTVSNMVTGVLRKNGYKVTNNSYGSNINAGIASVLITNSSLFGKPKNDIAVLEVDERSSLKIYPYIKPDYMVCNNILRDSVKRNANTDFITYIISSALPEDTKLILNGDDIICSSIGSEKNERIYFGVECHDPTEDSHDDIKDICYCPKCGAELGAEYLRYNHIGRVYCTKCDFKSPKLMYKVTDIDRKNGVITFDQNGNTHEYKMVNDNITNIYNMAASITLLDQMGLTYEQIAGAMKEIKVVGSRFGHEEYEGKSITTQLAKSQNPIACSRAFDYLKKSEGKDKVAIVIIDDKHDNNGDTENITWIYDCDYSGIADPSVKKVIFGGPRCHDHVLRAMLDGVDKNKIIITDSVFDTLNYVDVNESDCFFIIYDLYLVGESGQLKELLKKKIKEEAGK